METAKAVTVECAGGCGLAVSPERIANGSPYCSDTCRKRARERRRYHYRAPKVNAKRTARYRKEHTPVFDREFVAWDGEGYDGKLVLLANSRGDHLYRVNGMTTREAFDFLLSGPRDVANVWYGFGWDVNMMLQDLPFARETHSVRELAETGNTRWGRYSLTYWPRKNFGVKEFANGDGSFWSSDVLGFFQAPFLWALKDWNIEVPPIIDKGKAERSNFRTWSRDDLIAYNAAECELLVTLMNELRSACRAAGWTVSDWNGAGALAAHWLREHGVKRYLKEPKGRVAKAAEHAYFGGRTEAACWGNFAPVYHYDLNSAYPTAMRECIDLTKVRWEKTNHVPVQPFSLVHLRWRSPWEPKVYGPFPWRTRDGRILFPPEGEGWYYAVEVQAAQRRFGKRLRLDIVEAFEPIGEISYPVSDAIADSFVVRRRFKAIGDAAHVPIKLALNSLYGKMAQRVSRSPNGPPFHSLLWAGYITAATRARISDALALAGDQVACVMTDGVWSLVPIEGLALGSDLGEWSFEEADNALSIIGPGVYLSHRDDGTSKLYSRGYDRGMAIAIPDIIRSWERLQQPEGTMQVIPRFVGMKLALISTKKYRPLWRHFTTFEREIAPPWLTNSKRFHEMYRRPLRDGEPHWLTPYPLPEGSAMSYPYKVKSDEDISDEELREDRAADECTLEP